MCQKRHTKGQVRDSSDIYNSLKSLRWESHVEQASLEPTVLWAGVVGEGSDPLASASGLFGAEYGTQASGVPDRLSCAPSSALEITSS